MKNKADFEAANPGVIVDADIWSFDLKNYMTKAEGGDLPTMYHTSPTEVNNIVENGYAADITELVKKYGYDKMLNDEKYGKLYMRDGKYYGLVKDGSLYDMGIAYNIDLFRQADLLDENGVPKFPQTWEELAETAKVIKDKTGKEKLLIVINPRNKSVECRKTEIDKVIFAMGEEHKNESDKMIVAPCSAFVAKLK